MKKVHDKIKSNKKNGKTEMAKLGDSSGSRYKEINPISKLNSSLPLNLVKFR